MSDSSIITIAPAHLPDDLETVRTLFREYIDSLGIDLSFQDVDVELAQLPGKYAPPAGMILLARDGVGFPMGCIALRPTAREGTGELKRLYVRPQARSQKLGSRLGVEIMKYAQRAGYSRVVLDTLDSMHTARRLYKSLGFRKCPPITTTRFPAPSTSRAICEKIFRLVFSPST